MVLALRVVVLDVGALDLHHVLLSGVVDGVGGFVARHVVLLSGVPLGVENSGWRGFGIHECLDPPISQHLC